MKINSPEYSQMQRDRINKTKPWLKSTGPKTEAGKEKSKMNALKVSIELYRLLKEADSLFRQQRKLNDITLKNRS